MKQTKLLALIAVLLCMSMLFIACGGTNGGEQTTEATTTANPDTPLTPPTVSNTPEANQAALVSGINELLTNASSDETPSVEDVLTDEALAELYDEIAAITLEAKVDATQGEQTLTNFATLQIKDGILYVAAPNQGAFLLFLEEDFKAVFLQQDPETGKFVGDGWNVSDLIPNFDSINGGVISPFMSEIPEEDDAPEFKFDIPEFTADDLTMTKDNVFSVKKEYIQKVAHAYIEQYLGFKAEQEGATDAELQEAMTYAKGMIDAAIDAITFQLDVTMKNQKLLALDLLAEVKEAIDTEDFELDAFKIEVSFAMNEGAELPQKLAITAALPQGEDGALVTQSASLEILYQGDDICGAKVKLDVTTVEDYLGSEWEEKLVTHPEKGDYYESEDFDIYGDTNVKLDLMLDLSKTENAGDQFANVTFNQTTTNVKAYTWDKETYEQILDQAATEKYQAAYLSDTTFTVVGDTTEEGWTVSIGMLEKQNGEAVTDMTLTARITETVTNFPEITEEILKTKEDALAEYDRIIASENDPGGQPGAGPEQTAQTSITMPTMTNEKVDLPQ
ncbi:MAG: hypothetical protein IKC31_07700 [Clostridia bacterium]|nr:hypothetical protein [Clostridia bacterium]